MKDADHTLSADSALGDRVNAFPEMADIPFESERLFSASRNRVGEDQFALVKGALEQLQPMCSGMATRSGSASLDWSWLERQAQNLAGQGDIG